MGILTVLWEKYIEFKFEWFKITTTALVSPLLYLIAFGWGLGDSTVNGRAYIQFLIPGIIALSTMNSSFSAVGTSLNTQRIFEKSFKQIIISPTPWWQYLMGQMIGGALRGMYAGCLLLVISIPFDVGIHISPMFFVIMLINGIVFSALGILAAFMAKTHSDVNRFSTFVILPMTFLCNTFFPLEKVPGVLKIIINVLPLPHSSGLLRSIAYGQAINWWSVFVLIVYATLFFVFAILLTTRIKNF